MDFSVAAWKIHTDDKSFNNKSSAVYVGSPVRIGSSNTRSGGVSCRVSRAIVHPRYNGKSYESFNTFSSITDATGSHDIVLAELDCYVRGVQFAVLPRFRYKLNDGAAAYIAGWG